MAKNVPTVPAVEGNTKSSTAPALYWCFTHNFEYIKSEQYSIEGIVPIIKTFLLENEIEKKLTLICKKYCFSLECGGKENRYHLQGYVNLKKKLRLTQLKKVIKDTTHWEKCKGDEQSNLNYVNKNPIYTWDYIDKGNEFTEEQLGIIKKEDLFDWQLELEEIIKSKPDKRIIINPWSCCGNIGKSAFINYCLYHYDCGLIGGSRNDIMCNISGKDGKKPVKKCYFMNLERNTNVDKISYSALEQIKDGLIVSTKYESNYRQIPSPHIIVFSNKPLNTKKLSADRYVIKKLCYCVENKESDYIEDLE